MRPQIVALGGGGVVVFFAWLGLLWNLPRLAGRYGWSPDRDTGGAVLLAFIVTVVFWVLVIGFGYCVRLELEREKAS